MPAVGPLISKAGFPVSAVVFTLVSPAGIGFLGVCGAVLADPEGFFFSASGVGSAVLGTAGVTFGAVRVIIAEFPGAFFLRNQFTHHSSK